MTDIFTKDKRSWIMSRIKNKNSTAELLFRASLYTNGVRYRIHSKKIFGRPDISITKHRVVVFIDGDW